MVWPFREIVKFTPFIFQVTMDPETVAKYEADLREAEKADLPDDDDDLWTAERSHAPFPPSPQNHALLCKLHHPPFS